MSRLAVTDGAKLVALNLKVPAEIRAMLEAAARSSGHSLTQEASRRVVESFRDDRLPEIVEAAVRRALAERNPA